MKHGNDANTSLLLLLKVLQSVREVWGSNPGSVKSDTDGPRHYLRAYREYYIKCNIESIMKI